MSAGSYGARFVDCDRDVCTNRFEVPDEALRVHGDVTVYAQVREQAALAGWQTGYYPEIEELRMPDRRKLLDYCPEHRTDGKAVPGHAWISSQTYERPAMQALVIEVLVARARLGERRWPLPARSKAALEVLQAEGLLTFERGIDRTLDVTLTEEGRRKLLTSGYRTPVRKLVEEALHIVQNGEYAPGGTENWRSWAHKAEVFLRSAW